MTSIWMTNIYKGGKRVIVTNDIKPHIEMYTSINRKGKILDLSLLQDTFKTPRPSSSRTIWEKRFRGKV